MPEIVAIPIANVNSNRPPRPKTPSSAPVVGYTVAAACGFGIGIVVMLGVMMLIDSPSERETKLNEQVGSLKAERDRLVAAATVETVTFDGREWKLLLSDAIYFPFSKRFDGKEYRAIDDSNCRLLDCRAKDGERQLVSQTFIPIGSGKWVEHGRHERHFTDGTLYVSQYQMGVEEGLFEAYYANGKKHIERAIVGDQYHGTEKGWNEDGSLQYHVRNENGKEAEVFFPVPKK